MPDDVEKLIVPKFVTSELEQHLHPERISSNRLAFPSPFEQYPGKVVVSLYLSAQEYHEWWIKAGKGQPEEEERHWSCWEWETRFHLVKAWHIEGLDSEQLKEDPIDLPDNRFIYWILTITQPSLEEAVNLPNSPRPLKGTKKQLGRRKKTPDPKN
jgi:hypothetical protein